MEIELHNPLNNEHDRKLIIDAAQDFFYRYTRGEPFLSKLAALYASINALKRNNNERTYEPKDVFEVLYEELGYSLFSQYTGRRFFRSSCPSQAQLEKAIWKCLSPAAHYFIASPRLWEYGTKHFALVPSAADAKGYTVLMVAAKDKLIEIIDTILRNTSDPQERFALINHRNDRDQTLLDIIASRSRYYGTEGYTQIAQVILSYLDEQQRYIVLNNMKDEYQDVLKAMLAQKIVDNMPDSGLVLVSLVPPAVKKKAKARI